MIINDSFCYWDCQTMQDTCIIIFNMCMACVLLFFVVRTFVRARSFFKDYWPNRWHLEQMQSRITENSKIYQIIDELPGVIVQTLLLLIPLQIIGNMVMYGLLRKKVVTKMVSTAKVYLFVRFFMLSPGVILFAFENDYVVDALTQVKVALVVFDCFVCLFFLIFVRKQSTSSSEPLTEKVNFIQPLKKELDLLIGVGFARVTINITTFLITPNIYQFNSYKNTCVYGKGFYDGDVYFTVSDIFLADYLMHFLPIYVIRKMYEPPAE